MSVIMTVEDSRSTRRIIVDTLLSENHEVIEAENGAEGLKKSVGKTIDLIITDINMPEIDGIEMTRQLRAGVEHKFTPIVMLTTESADGKKNAGKEAGATAWIIKPFDPDKLLAVVNKILR